MTLKFCRTGIQSASLAISLALAAPAISANAQDTDIKYNGPEITFEQIYANPGNHELNLAYARQQASRGDLISAVAALERMLYAQADWDSARLFYALVLYKLDDKQAALRELDYLESRPLSAEQRVQANAYRKEFEKEGVRSVDETGFTGRAVLGARYDDNAGNALSDAVITNNNQDDFAVFAQGAVRYIGDVSESGDWRYSASVNGQTLRHETFSNSDYDAIGGRLALMGDLGDYSLNISGEAAQVYISGGKYLTQYGPRVTLTRAVSPEASIFASAAYYDQNYDNLSSTTGENLRSGDKLILSIGGQNQISPATLLSGSVLYENKDAQNPAFAYDGFRLSADLVHDFDSGLYAKLRASYRNLSYDAIDRKDDHISARAGLGASISAIRDWMGMERGNMESVYLEGAVDYLDRSSNIALFEYENFGTEIRLIWDF